jgi:hypothetical protein
MTSLAFNPITVAIGGLAAIILLTAIPWERLLHWCWYSASDKTPDRPMPWEQERTREHASSYDAGQVTRKSLVQMGEELNKQPALEWGATHPKDASPV